MIRSDRFVWQHFPKTGGHAVDQALRELGDAGRLVHDDDAGGARWHDSVAVRQARDVTFDPRERVIISGIRRLPHWILSRVHFDASRSPYLGASREMICRGEFYEQSGAVGRADLLVRQFVAGGVHRWIRTEHLGEDFERVFTDLLPHPRLQAAVRKVRRIVNGTQLNYVREPGFHFTAAELDGLYACNPTWAAVEREVYGDLLSSRDEAGAAWYVLDRDLRFRAVSDEAISLWGRPRDEVVGRRLTEVFPQAVGSDALRVQQAVLREREPRSFATRSSTYDTDVALEVTPHPAGVRVRFDFGPSPASPA